MERQSPTVNSNYPAFSHEGDGNSEHGGSRGNSWLRWAGRCVLTAVILFIVSFLTPGFSIAGMWSFLIAAVVISLLDALVERLIRTDAKPFGNGLKGFALSALILYFAQFLVPNMNVTVLGAILGAVAIGILDAVFPLRVM